MYWVWYRHSAPKNGSASAWLLVHSLTVAVGNAPSWLFLSLGSTTSEEEGGGGGRRGKEGGGRGSREETRQ